MFDAAKVTGNLVVRRARAGETLLALDGKTYNLDDTCCVIADETGVESLAGIMGGEVSGCSGDTTDVLIESALWNELNIAQTGRRLGLNSDARYRFERGVDPAFCLPGLELATQLVLEFCGGEPSEVVLAGEVPDADRVITFPLDEVKRLAGVELQPDPHRQHPARRSASTSSAKARWSRWRCRRGAPTSRARPTWSRRWCAFSGVDNVPSVPFPRGPEARRAGARPRCSCAPAAPSGRWPPAAWRRR